MCNRDYIKKHKREQAEREAIISEASELLRNHDYDKAQLSIYRLKDHGGKLRSYEWVQIQDVVERANKWTF